MGADIKSLRTRIKSVDSTLHLTKAMGLVASSKIRRASDAMQKGRQYEQALSDAMRHLTSSPECARSPFMAKREGGKLCIIIIAGDRGLAGGYNANIFRLARQYPDARFIPIGKRACDRYRGGYSSVEDFSYNEAITLAKELCADFAEGVFDTLAIIGTKYVSMMTQEPYIKYVLPLESSEKAQSQSMIFEPDEMTVMNAIVSEYVAGHIVAAARESFASEVAARRCAMDSAGKNAQEMIDSLQLDYNRARQGAITQEITEIVAGSGAQ